MEESSEIELNKSWPDQSGTSGITLELCAGIIDKEIVIRRYNLERFKVYQESYKYSLSVICNGMSSLLELLKVKLLIKMLATTNNKYPN